MKLTMNTFSIKSKEDAQKFSEMLGTYQTANKLGSVGEDNFLPELFEVCGQLELGGRIFNAVVDLELTYLFMFKDMMCAGGTWNDSFSPGKLEGGSILDHYSKFHGKIKILYSFNSFTFRCRAFWDKYMGILVLIFIPDEYDKFCKAKSRKKKFRRLSSKWNDFPLEIQRSLIHQLQKSEIHQELTEALDNGGIFPNPFIDIFFTLIEKLDNHYRTPEAHGTGSVRKWSLSMLPIEQSKDFGLINHWNLANTLMQGLRNALIKGQFGHNKSMQPNR